MGQRSETILDPRKLHKACRDGNVHFARELLDHMKPEDMNYPDKSCGNTALHLAAEANHDAMMKMLLSRRLVDINAKNNEGETPLILASKMGYASIVALLLDHENQGVNVNMQDQEGNTALLLALWKGHIGIVWAILNAGGVNLNAQNMYGGTALIIAARDGHREVVEYLLEHDDVDLNAVTLGGYSAIMLAEWNGGNEHEEIVRLLRERGAIQSRWLGCCIQ